jgi:hypothetical protein
VVHAPDEPPPPLTFTKSAPAVVDLDDDEDELIDSTFDELDDPDGLLRNGLVNGHRAELFDDEDLDLLGDVDDEPPAMASLEGIAERGADRADGPARRGETVGDRFGERIARADDRAGTGGRTRK